MPNSTKPLLYPSYMADPKSIQRYFADPILANPAGHEVLADVLVSFFQSQICAAWAAVTGRSSEVLPTPGLPTFADNKAKQPTDARGLFGGVAQRKGAAAAAAAPGIDYPDDDAAALFKHAQTNPNFPGGSYPQLRVPPVRIGQRPADLEARPFEEVAPYCVSANDLINPVPASSFAGSGWVAYNPAPGSAELSSHAHYFYSTLPTSRFRVALQVGAGDIGVYYLREPRSQVGEGSAIECWVDDNYNGAIVLENSADVGEPVPA